MPNGTLLIGFVATSLVVLLIPGPGVLYVVARSASQGYRAGLASVVGLSIGALVHVMAAAAGLSAILLTSATAFNVVKLVGAGYLIYLGIRTLFAKRPASDINVATTLSRGRLVRDGIVVSLFNPKIAVFFLAFLPQFVDPGLGMVPRQIVFLGILYVGLALLTDSLYALLASSIGHRIKQSVDGGPWLQYLSGSFYVALGVTTALTDRRP